MADQKLTALTLETNPSGDDLLYIVDDPGGTPISKKVTLRTAIFQAYGELKLTDGSGVYSATSGVWAQLKIFTGQSGVSEVINEDIAGNALVAGDGTYMIHFSAAWTGPGISTLRFAPYFAGGSVSAGEIETITHSSGEGNISFTTIGRSAGGTDDWEMFCKADISDTFTFSDANFSLCKIGP